MIKRICDWGKFAKTLEQRREESSDGYAIIHRVGDLHKNAKFYIHYFAFDLDYYDNTETDYTREFAKQYILDLNANIWDPISELNLEPKRWMDIRGAKKVFEENNISYYNDEDIANWLIKDMDKDWSAVSTDDLAYIGKEKGYQATYLANIPQPDTDERFDEIAVYDLSIIEEI